MHASLCKLLVGIRVRLFASDETMHSEPADTPKPVGCTKKSFPELLNEDSPRIGQQELLEQQSISR